MMKYAAIVVGVLLVLSAAIGLWFWRSRQRATFSSFWDLVRNPGLMPDYDRLLQETKEAASALSGSPDEIRQLVDYVVIDATAETDVDDELRILANLGEETYPRALEILRDPVLKGRLTDASFNRLCDLFARSAPPPIEAAPLLAPFLQSESEDIRKNAALVIGSIGAADSLADLRRALTDKDEYVRCYALMGIQRAIEGGRIEAAAKQDFFELAASLWPDDTSFNVCGELPKILLQLDRERAISFLLDNKLFSVQFDAVWRILQVLRQESVEVPRERLLSLIAEADQEPIKYPLDNVIEEALPLLGAHHNADDLPMIERFLNHENKDIAKGAIAGFYHFHRYYDRIRDPWDVVEKDGWAGLTEVEKSFVRSVGWTPRSKTVGSRNITSILRAIAGRMHNED